MIISLHKILIMKKLVSIIICYFIVAVGIGQNKYNNSNLEYILVEGKPVFKLTLDNIYAVLRMSHSVFEEKIQSELKYTRALQAKGFVASNKGAPYTINKEPATIIITWYSYPSYAIEFKDQIEEAFTGYKDGWSLYNVIDPEDEKYGLIISLKEEQSGAGLVGIKRVLR